MPKAVRFYLTLGFTLIVDTPHYARFTCPDDGATFSLSLSDTDIVSTTTIYFEDEQLDRWIETIEARGIRIEQYPIDQSYLWREAIVIDPSGNKIKLYYAAENRLNPPWKVHKTFADLT